MSKPRQRKVRNYLLNKSLQLRYVVLVTTMSALISGSLGFVIWSQEKHATERIVATFEASDFAGDPDLKGQIVTRLTNHDTGLVELMSIAGVGLIVALSLYLVVMTHKVAGPLFKVGVYFDKMAAGRLGAIAPLRRGDMLVHFYEGFRGAHDALRKRHQAQNEVVGRFLAACDTAGVPTGGPLGHALDELRSHQRERANALS